MSAGAGATAGGTWRFMLKPVAHVLRGALTGGTEGVAPNRLHDPGDPLRQAGVRESEADHGARELGARPGHIYEHQAARSHPIREEAERPGVAVEVRCGRGQAVVPQRVRARIEVTSTVSAAAAADARTIPLSPPQARMSPSSTPIPAPTAPTLGHLGILLTRRLRLVLGLVAVCCTGARGASVTSLGLQHTARLRTRQARSERAGPGTAPGRFFTSGMIAIFVKRSVSRRESAPAGPPTHRPPGGRRGARRAVRTRRCSCFRPTGTPADSRIPLTTCSGRTTARGDETPPLQRVRSARTAPHGGRRPLARGDAVVTPGAGPPGPGWPSNGPER